MKWLLVVASCFASIGHTVGIARAECPQGPGPVRQTLVLPDGRQVALHTRAVLLDDRVYDRCSGLPDPFPTSMAILEGDLFVGFREQGVARLRRGRFERLAAPTLGTVRDLASTGDRLWVATPSGLFRWSGREGLAPVAQRRLRRAAVADLAVDERGRLHVATTRGWWVYTGKRWILRAREPVGCLRGDPVRPASPLTCAPEPEDRPVHVTALAVGWGTLFAATFDEGLYRRSGDRWVREPNAPRFINALAAGPDALMLATPHGVARRDRHGEYTEVELGLAGSHVNGLVATPEGELWVASSEGLYRWDGRTVRVYDARHGLPASTVFAVARTTDGAVWAATAGGVARLAGGAIRAYRHEDGTLPHDWVTSLAPDGTGVLAGTYDRGVARLSPDGTCEPIAALADLWVNPGGIARTGKGWLVATLGDGLVSWDGRDSRVIASLPSEDVTAVAYVAHELWVGTRRGLAAIPWPSTARE